MKNNKGIIGHIDHGSTCLSSDILKVLSEQEQKVIVIVDEKERGIQFKEPEPLLITNPRICEAEIKSGRELRRERRKQQRKNKK